ncbi:hypothetical protein KAR91_23555 [Candidatus Pacearchaeota archaeon]|nr:hypothetical protein [Candidatus Pacearchaeota archaeon]
MAIIQRTRTLRPSTRKPKSVYKVDTKNVKKDDNLKLIIFMEGEPTRFLGEFHFDGSNLTEQESIHFRADAIAGKWHITFICAQPKSFILR